jgi:hypothetical protein
MRRSAAPPWRRAGTRTRVHVSAASRRPWFAGPPGHRSAGRPWGRKPDGHADARSHLVCRGAISSIRRGVHPFFPASRVDAQLSTSTSTRPQHRGGGSSGASTAARSEHGRLTDDRSSAAHRTDGAATARSGADVGGRDARRDVHGHAAGRGSADRDHLGRPRATRRRAGHRPVLVAAVAGTGGRGAVPRADAPVRPGPPRGGPGGGGQRRDRRRGGHRGLRRPPRRPRCRLAAARGRAADHLRTGGPGRRRRDVRRIGGRAGHGRRRPRSLPDGLPALGRAPRAGQLPRPAPAADADARPAPAGTRAVARAGLSGRAPRAGCATGPPDGCAAG